MLMLLIAKDGVDNPHEIPQGQPLEEFLDANFILRGPFAQEELSALTDELPDGRYWASLAIGE